MTPAPPTRRFDAVIFDFGGVLSSGIGEAMGAALNGSRVSLAEFLPVMLGPLDDDTDHPWHRIERGEITADECFADIGVLAKEAGLDDFPSPPTGDQMMASLRSAPAMIDAARRVRAAGYATAILTNIFHEAAGWRDVCGADDLVDVIVESCVVGMRKPAREIYEYTLDQLGGIAPDRALFLDDFPWNITGAQAVGLHTLHVTNSEAAAAELLTLLL